MTVEQWLGLSTDDMEAMTESELEAHFEPLLRYTRPERRETRDGKPAMGGRKLTAQEQAIEMLKNMGMKI